MKIDYLIRKEGELSTYHEEKLPLMSNPKQRKQLIRIEHRILEATDYRSLVRMLEVKPLDPATGLKEIKVDQLRVLHFLFVDETVVLLGIFLKKTQETPNLVIQKNNTRIKEYLRMHHGKPSHD